MADKTPTPLMVNLRERLKDKHTRETAHRIAPPTATHMATVHRLPEKAPQVEPAEAMPKKDKRGFYTPEYKAKIVARLLEAKEAGTPTQQSILDAEGVSGALAYNWIRQAKEANGHAPKKKRKKRADKTVKVSAANGKSRAGNRGLETVVNEYNELSARMSELKAELLTLLQ